MKMATKLVNSVSTCVEDSIRGTLVLSPQLRRLRGQHVLVREDLAAYKQTGRVTIVTGGGSGHEPAFAGYVGRGMASCAVMGQLFASPGPAAILEGIRAAGKGSDGGVLVFINNYTGDRLNFGLAMERARVEGIEVSLILHADDCANLQRDRTAGRRGLAGFTLALKILGAAAENGSSLSDLTKMHDVIQRDIGTLGVCVSPCSLPGTGPLFSITPGHMELGLGLHGEAGIKTIKAQSATEIIYTVITEMTSPGSPVRFDLKSGDSLAVLLNNFCATSNMEMNILAVEAVSQLEKRGARIERVYMSRLSTSMDMAGFSLTLLKLDEQRKVFLDDVTNAPAWPSQCHLCGNPDLYYTDPNHGEPHPDQEQTASVFQGTPVSPEIAQNITRGLKNICESLLDAEAELNYLDTVSGDGDCGSTLKDGAEAILTCMRNGSLPLANPYDMFVTLADVAEKSMGGSSGGFYSLLLTGVASSLKATPSEPASWVDGLENGIQLLQRYGGACPGDRTMLDPLCAAHEVLKNMTTSDPHMDIGPVMKQVAQAAETSAAATADMMARAGRASYVRASALTQPDPGAQAVAIACRALYQAIWE